MPNDQLPPPAPADDPITDPAWLTAALNRRATSAAYRMTLAQLADDRRKQEPPDAE
jgi:hypothetical protein